MVPEVDLVRLAIDGGEAAFASLYDRYARPVLLFLSGRLRERADAEDALQATFVAAWSALPRLRRPERFAGWIFRIARNKARDVHRRRGLRPVPLREDLTSGDPPTEIDEADDRLRSLVESLKPDTRSVVLLRAVEEWSAEEVANALGLSASTVRRRYARAMEHLRTGLEEGVEG